MTGTKSRALWLVGDQAGYRLTVEAKPFCEADQRQYVSIEVNGVPLAEYRWNECESWGVEIVIPGSLVPEKWNELDIRAAHATSPFDITDGESGDRHQLSIGFNQAKH